MPKGQFDAFDESKRFVVARNVSGDLIKSVFVCYQGFAFRPHIVARARHCQEVRAVACGARGLRFDLSSYQMLFLSSGKMLYDGTRNNNLHVLVIPIVEERHEEYVYSL